MKLRQKITSIMLSFIMLTGTAVTASAQTTGASLEFEKINSAQTVITFTNGRQNTYDGALKAESALANISSYEIKVNGKTLLTVTPNGVSDDNSVGASQTSVFNGYYAVDISNIEGNKSAFVTGLPIAKVKQVENAVIEAAKNGTELNLSAAGFIDSELCGVQNYDQNLSWAAAFSNALTYTGWARKAGFANCDDLTDKIAASFNNDGFYDIIPASAWFFNGVYDSTDYGESYFPVTAPKKGTGGYLKDYTFETIVKSHQMDEEVGGMKQLVSALRSGKGVVIGALTSDESQTQLYGIRFLSCWGYVTDDNYSENSEKHYSMLICSAPDTDKTGSKSRGTAPNRINSLQLFTRQSFTFDADTIVSWQAKSLKNSQYDSFMQFYTIEPYSDDFPKETNPKATKDKLNNCDFSVNRVLAGQANGKNEELLPDDSDIYLTVEANNVSAKEYINNIQIKYEIKDENGSVVYNRTKQSFFEHYGSAISNAYYYSQVEGVNIGKLAPGKYSGTATINPSGKVAEAYFINNSCSFELNVAKPVLDKSSLKLIAENPVPGEDGVTYSIRVEGLTPEQRGLIKQSVITEMVTEDGNEIDFDLEEEFYPQGNSGSPLPKTHTIANGANSRFRLIIYFENHPPVYLYSNSVSPDYPELTLGDPNAYDFDQKYFKVAENTTQIISGNRVEFRVENPADNGADVSGKYYLRATGKLGRTIQLTKPVSFSLKKGEYKTFRVNKLDYPLPYGLYRLEIVLEGKFTWSDYSDMSWVGTGEPNDRYTYSFDLNDDGKTDINDVTVLQKHLAKLTNLSGKLLKTADADQNGVVNIADATIIQNFILIYDDEEDYDIW